jgi:hypothetical protein
MNITQESEQGERKSSPCISHDKETLIHEQFERLNKAKAGLKYDSDKTRYDLYPLGAYEGCSKVLTFGAKKYTPNGWKTVPDASNRYYSALIRHLNAQKEFTDKGGVGLLLDDESGLPHLDHAQCCLVFLREITNNLNNS